MALVARQPIGSQFFARKPIQKKPVYTGMQSLQKQAAVTPLATQAATPGAGVTNLQTQLNAPIQPLNTPLLATSAIGVQKVGGKYPFPKSGLGVGWTGFDTPANRAWWASLSDQEQLQYMSMG